MNKASSLLSRHCRVALEALLDFPCRTDYVGCGHLLQHFCDRRLSLQGKQLHARFVVSFIKPDNYIASKLINFYAKSVKDLAAAQKVFDQITKPNTFSYNALLIGYSCCNNHDVVLRLFFSMLISESVDVCPDGYSVTCLLKSLLGYGIFDFRTAREVHAVIMKNKLDEDVVVGNALITYYSKCESLLAAKKVFDKMTIRDVVTWNSIISGFSQAGYYEDTKKLFQEMRNCSRFQPDVATVVSVLQACGQSKDLVFGMDVHKFVVEHNVKMDIFVCNALIGVYAKCGSLNYAWNLFEEMSCRDEVTYNTIISAYMEHGYVDKALALFERMEIQGLGSWNAIISGLMQNNLHDTVVSVFKNMLLLGNRPNSVTIASILPALSNCANLKGSKETHSFALKNDCFKNVYVATGIVDAYAKSGFLSGARIIFEQLKGRSLMFWTSIITAYSAHGDADSALKLFYEMLNVGIRPDRIVFIAVLASCAHSGLICEAKRIFNAMTSEFGIQPSVEHYTCMVDALGKAGKLSEAKDIVFNMPMKPNAKVWGALFNGAALSGDIDLGEIAFFQLIEIEPNSIGNYVTMVNMYSRAGRWKQADRIREKMNCIGQKKMPGSSWTEKLS